jgi:hypothetical protein
VLPARFAWLASAVAVILVRKSAALLPASASVATVGTAVTASVAAPITAAITIEPSATSARRTTRRGFGTGFVHFQIAPADFFPIEAGNRLGCFRIIRHLNKCESASAPCLPVHRDVNPRDLSKLLEQRTQIRFGRLETHVANKQVLHMLLSFDLWKYTSRAHCLPPDSVRPEAKVRTG